MTIALRTTTAEPGFRAALAALLDRAQGLDARVEDVVREVIGAVRRRGDAALLDYTARFDRWTPASAAALEIPQALLAQAAQKIPAEQRTALEQAAARHAPLPRASENRFLELHRGRRHAARPAGHGPRPRWAVRPRRQGRLSIVGVDECHPRQGRGRGRAHHGGADPGRPT